MTNIERDLHTQRPLLTDDQLRLTLEDLLQGANLPQLWFIFLDSDARVTGPLMPGDGYPDDPCEIVVTEDLGDVTAARMLTARLGLIAELVDAASVVLVWERPGPDELTPETRAWVRAIAQTSRADGLHLRAQLLLHDEGLRMLVPDDFV